jgi:adenosyl cobinamide kinase/adenosyl cobinamide phosphate guanylyltransferase
MSITTDPQLTQINLFYKKDFYEKASNYLGAIQSYSTELGYAIEHSKAKVANDPITAMSDFYVKMDNRMKSMGAQFTAHWIKNYNLTLEKVRNEVGLKIGTGTFYRSFGDSIGSIARQETLYDESTTSIQNKAFPVRYGSSMSNKIHPQIQLLYADFSNKLNKIFNQNLQNIQSTGSLSTKSHGENLVPDVEHSKRIQSIIATLNQKIRNEFKELYNVILLYCQYNPRASTQNIQFVPNFNITVNVEGNNLNQDILFNQLQEVKKDIVTKTILGLG